jgi:TRAP-type C4-dicarboxylate transport system substrate-binding protein
MLKTRGLTTLALILALAAVLAASPALAAKTIRWQIDSGTAYSSRDDWCVVLLDEFADKVAQRTDGKFKITISIGGELGIKSGELPNAVSAGRIQGAVMATGHIAGSFPFLNVYGLPFLFSNLEEGLKVHNAVEPIADREFRKKGFAPAAFYIMTPVGLWSKVDIPDLNNLDNLKVRCWDETTANIVKTLGGVPIIMPVTEAYTALQRGVIQAVLTGAPAMLHISGHEICKYGYLINLAPACVYLTYNLKAFDQLPEEYQDIFLEEAAVMAGKFVQAQPKEDNRSLDQMREAGVELIKPSDEQMAELKKSVRPLWKTWMEETGPLAQEAGQAAMAAVGVE